MIGRWLIRIVSIGALVAIIATIVADAWLGFPSSGIYLAFAPTVVAFLVVGWLLAERRPSNPIGPLCVLFGVIFAAYFPIDLLHRLGSTSPIVEGLAVLSTASDAPGFIIVAMVLILFPDGRTPSPRWRWAIWLAVVGVVCAFVGFTLKPGPLAAFPAIENPFGLDGFPGELVGELGYIALVILLIAAVASFRVRWRRGSPLERTQIKWIGAASVGVLVVEIANLLTFDPSDPFKSPAIQIAATLVLAAIPLAIGIAILRYRLYEIDRIVSRTLSYAIVTGVLAAVFVGVILLLQTVLAGITGNQGIPVAISTLAVFALFQPVLRRVRRAVDRRFDRARYDGERTAGAFAERLRWETDMERVTGDLVRTAGSAVAPRDLSIWLRPPGAPR